MKPTKRPSPSSLVTAPLERREFLNLALGGAATLALAACGDDLPGETAEDEGSTTGSSGGSGSGSTEAEGSSTLDSLDETGTTTGEPDPACEEPDGFEEDFDAEAIPADDATFPLAVLAGEMQPESIMLSIFIADAEPKTLRVWREAETEGTVVVVAEQEVQPDANGYAQLTIEGLCPGTWYHYAYFVGEVGDFTGRSIIGRVRTAIAEDALEPLTLAMTSCCGASLDWPALERTATEDYDMFLHLGDMAYNDGAFTLAEYRVIWRSYMSAPGYRSALARSGLYVTWDDHEVDDNSNWDNETTDPMQLEKLGNAMDAFFELLPVERQEGDRLWRSFRWGLTAEIIMLDCRYERQPSRGLYISPEQMDWLKQRLSDSPCHFKLIMNSVPITNMAGGWDVASPDRWEGFPAQRDEILAHIDDNDIRGVWWLAGDFHVCFVSRLEPEGDSTSALMREIAVTGGNVNPFNDVVAPLDPPQFEYGVKAARGCILTFDPEADEVQVRFIDPETGDDDYNEVITQD